jgi:4-hydroxy-tetrahydrodipicolinate reductase
MALTVLINGARGRMGHALAAAAEAAGVRVGAGVDVGDDLGAAAAGCDVLVDFSSPAGTRRVAEVAVARKLPVVIGTTGHSAAERAELRALLAPVPCVWAGNFSVGVNVLFHLTQQAAHLLDASFDAEVVEMHHRFKQDAPSGTAARLAEIILEERKLTSAALRPGRSGMTGPRTSAEVGIHSLRGGDVVGDHTVVFAAIGERVELTHKASDRAILARGALRAAQWIVTRPAGIYDMQDVLGLRAAAP